jgi:hypothetical protein
MRVDLPRQANDRILDQRQKLEGLNFQAVPRVGVTAASEARARHLMNNVRTVLGSARTLDNSFQPRPVLGSVAKRHIAGRHVPLLFPAQSGLPQARARHLSATEGIPRTGRVIAVSNFPGAERPAVTTYAEPWSRGSCQRNRSPITIG